jgi:succinate dehydrogenase / fumarate reductase iron-sulfur subunit
MKKVKVFRYLPGSESHWQDYQIEADPEDTILTVLNNLRIQDPTLSFRSSCRSAVCGSCAMVINGKFRLACKTKVGSINRDEIVLSPLPGLKVIKDLIVDLEPFWDAYRKIMPWLVEKPDGENMVITNEVSDLMEKFYVCLLCGSCYAACPEAGVDRPYLGPAPLMEGYRFICDPRDAITDERMKVVGGDEGAWGCDGAFACIDACPWDVAPIEYVAKIRTAATKLRLGFK